MERGTAIPTAGGSDDDDDGFMGQTTTPIANMAAEHADGPHHGAAAAAADEGPPMRRQRSTSSEGREASSAAAAAGGERVFHRVRPSGSVFGGALGGVVDPRLLEKPEKFSGNLLDWRRWETFFRSWICNVDSRFDAALREAETRTMRIGSINPTVIPLDRFLRHELLGLIEGDNASIVIETESGFEAWRRLHQEYELLTGGRKLMRIEELLHPTLGSEDGWRRRWKRWEEDVARCLAQTGMVIPDDMKIAIIRHRAPDDLKRHLRVSARSYEGNYLEFREQIESYWRALEGPVDGSTEGSTRVPSMEIDFLSSRSGRQGGSPWKVEVTCWYCGRRGHLQRDCRSWQDYSAVGPRSMTVKKPFTGTCFECGQRGHRAVDCEQRKPKAVNSMEMEGGEKEMHGIEASIGDQEGLRPRWVLSLEAGDASESEPLSQQSFGGSSRPACAERGHGRRRHRRRRRGGRGHRRAGVAAAVTALMKEVMELRTVLAVLVEQVRKCG
mmetsp:Transcript_48003/g.126645  ORF Transcript_48003/g.126645 Transcript_48003/m.126645 type:complete len:499 (-) Transcript_48003:1652-3148(-)